jgi:AcrR family transcriptional regulator
LRGGGKGSKAEPVNGVRLGCPTVAKRASHNADVDAAESNAALRSAASRQAILDAARSLFATRGYAATSISEIVGRAGTSVGLPYYHFGSKKEIFITLWTEFQVSQEARSRAAIGAARELNATGKELFLAGTRAYLQGAWEARQIVPLVLSRDTPAGFDALEREMVRRWERQNETLLSEYDPVMARTATRLLNGALRAVCLQFPRLRGDAEADQLIENVLTLCAGMLSAL